jgi:signal transduction histidine kinase
MVEVLNLETSARGFVITGDDALVNPLREAERRLPALLEDLRRTRPAGTDQEWPQRIEAIRNLVLQRQQHAESVIELRRSGDVAAAQRSIRADADKRATGEIQELLDGLERSSRERLDAHLVRLQWETGVTRAAVVLGLVVAVAFMLYSIVRVTREFDERRRAERARVEANRELEAQAAELRQANRELEAFSYSVSHDLRAPLRGVDRFSRILAEDYGPQLDDEGRRLIGVIRGEAHRMGRLIDDMLNLSRAGRQLLEPTNVDMNDLVRDVIAELTRLYPGAAPEFVIGHLPPAWGDRGLLRQVWVNLVANALKFSARRPAPRIEVGGARRAGAVEYFVRDNGVGFDPKHVGLVFGVFQRLHSESEFEGTGVGLALVQRIVHRHGGSVRADGAPGAGATFHVSLPARNDP